jgi:hypothetical protein
MLTHGQSYILGTALKVTPKKGVQVLAKQGGWSEELAELAAIIGGLPHGRPAQGYSIYRGRSNPAPPTPYERAFELVQALCDKLYPGTDSTAVSWQDWKHLPRASEAQLDGCSLMPLGSPIQIRAASRLLMNTILYSEVTIVVVNARLEDQYISYSGGGTKNWPEFWKIFDLLASYREILARGRCIFLPATSGKLYGSVSEETRHERRAPWTQESDSIFLTPINPARLVRERSALADVLVYEKLVLPCFPSASLLDIEAFRVRLL